MTKEQLFAAAFLYLNGEENGMENQILSMRFSSDDVVDLIEKEGLSDLAETCKNFHKAIDDMSSAVNSTEYTDAESRYRLYGEKLDKMI